MRCSDFPPSRGMTGSGGNPHMVQMSTKVDKKCRQNVDICRHAIFKKCPERSDLIGVFAIFHNKGRVDVDKCEQMSTFC